MPSQSPFHPFSTAHQRLGVATLATLSLAISLSIATPSWSVLPSLVEAPDALVVADNELEGASSASVATTPEATPPSQKGPAYVAEPSPGNQSEADLLKQLDAQAAEDQLTSRFSPFKGPEVFNTLFHRDSEAEKAEKQAEKATKNAARKKRTKEQQGNNTDELWPAGPESPSATAGRNDLSIDELEPGAELPSTAGAPLNVPMLNNAVVAIPKPLAHLSPTMKAELMATTIGMHEEHQAVRNELRDEEEAAFSDIMLLWQAAVERHDSIRYAIEKLSRKDATGQAVGPSMTQKLMANVLSIAGTAGQMVTGTPTGLITGDLVNDVVNGDPNQSAMSRVTDADMLIIAKEVEALQSDIIQKYYAYKHTYELWTLAREAKNTLSPYYVSTDEAAQNDPMAEALQPVLAGLFEDVSQQEAKARQDYQRAREALQFNVGPEALAALEDRHRQKTR